MDELTQVMNTDFSQTFIDIVIILVAFVFIFNLAEKVSVIIGKPFKWIKKNDEDHKILMDAIATMKSMQETHAKDKEESDKKSSDIENVLSTFMIEVKEEIKQFANNRIHDREKSIEIQKELKDSIKAIVKTNTARDNQIDALMNANKEILAENINSKYKYYVSIGGIPEDEYDEFVSMHKAYKGVGGNHHGDAKYSYCINHLPVISVGRNLIKRDEI